VLIQSRPYNSSHRWSAVADLHTSPVITIDIQQHTVDSAIKDRRNTNPRIKIFLVDSHSDFERLQDDSDCIMQVNEESASVFLWTRRLLQDSPPSSHTSTTTQPQHPRSHRKLATRPNCPTAQSTMPQFMSNTHI
jgi:hypothetical protein